jgi:hypothetical protein
MDYREPAAVAGDTRVVIERYDRDAEAAARLSDRLLWHPTVRAHLAGGDLRVASFELLDKDADDAARFEAVVCDPADCRCMRLRGTVDDPEGASAYPLAHRPLPSEENFGRAVEVVLRDERLRPLVDAGESQAYRPMPPYLDIQSPDGSVERLVTVGIRSQGGVDRHRIVAVRLRDGAVMHDPPGVPQPSTSDCDPTPEQGGCAPSAGPDQVRVRVISGRSVLWDFVVVRPRASSGIVGSGVELRFVDYRGTRVLYRAHVPILNVQYGPEGVAAGCGPTYRDWQNEEYCFRANGSDPVGAGFRLCSAPPQTILESGGDGGNFRGVALWHDGKELRLVSQLRAGWYRYISDWRLRNDGSIGPRFGFAATANPCTCHVHTHHAYWRLDFDVVTAGNNVVEEYNNPPIIGSSSWHTKKFEIRRQRDAAHQRHWRVRNRGSFQGYSIEPGAHDGVPDPYGIGDVWVLRYHGNEIDDGQGFTSDPTLSRTGLDKFISGESVDGQDVALWYAGHFRHDERHPDPAGHIVGPELRPFSWSAPFTRAASARESQAAADQRGERT